MKFSQKVILKTGLLKHAYFVSKVINCAPYEVYVGNYRYNLVEGIKFKAVLGNADFSECENMDLSKLKFVGGNLVLNDTCNIKVGVEYVGKSVFCINAFNIDMSSLKYVNEGVYLNDSIISSIKNLEKANWICATPNFVKNQSEYVQRNIKCLVNREVEK